EATRHAALARLEQELTDREQEFISSHQARIVALEHEFEEAKAKLGAEWQRTIGALYGEIESINESAATLFPSWDDPAWQHWAPPQAFTESVPFARLDIDLE